MAITVFITLELFMKLLYYTPMAVLASIILSALPGLIDIKEACNIWKIDKMDFLTCLGAFLGVLFGSVEIGLGVAVRCLIQTHIHLKITFVNYLSAFLTHGGADCCSLPFPSQRSSYSRFDLR